MRSPRFTQLHHADHAAVRAELLQGLTAPAAHTSPKFLYDALGSRLFEAITELPEYYPTRTESAIFASHGSHMAAHIPAGATLIDLGAGNCHKAASLFGTLQPSGYVAVDISSRFFARCAGTVATPAPRYGHGGPWGWIFLPGLVLPHEVMKEAAPSHRPRVLFYAGSSIGNFTPDDALGFLRSVHVACAMRRAAAC